MLEFRLTVWKIPKRKLLINLSYFWCQGRWVLLTRGFRPKLRAEDGQWYRHCQMQQEPYFFHFTLCCQVIAKWPNNPWIQARDQEFFESNWISSIFAQWVACHSHRRTRWHFSLHLSRTWERENSIFLWIETNNWKCPWYHQDQISAPFKHRERGQIRCFPLLWDEWGRDFSSQCLNHWQRLTRCHERSRSL